MNNKTHLTEPIELQEDDLKKEIGVWGLSANIINVVVGAGIFVLPALVAQKMGSTSILAYLLCGGLIFLIMLCFAEVGSKIIKTGGAYTFIETVFGKYAGFLSGNLLILAGIFSDAAVANALVKILSSIFPALMESWIRVLFLFVIFSSLTIFNVRGIKSGIGLVKFNTIAKLLPLLILISFGWTEVSLINLSWSTSPSFPQIGEAALILFFAFQGGDIGISVTGEVANPKKTIPKAIVISTIFIVSLYVLIQLICQGVLGNNTLSQSTAPLADTAQLIFGAFGFLLLTVGAAISMFGNLSGEVLNNPRILYAFSRDKVIPTQAFSRIHPKFATPYISIIIYASLGFLMAVVGGFEQLAVASSLIVLLLYLGVVLALIKMRSIESLKQEGFTIKGGLAIPILASLVIIYFLLQSSQNEVIGALILFAIFTLIYYFTKILKK